MANWRLTINVSNIWKRYEEPFEENPEDEELFEDFKSEMVPHLQSYISKVQFNVNDIDEAGRYSDLLMEMEDALDLEEFNEIWNELYNWADYNRIWIQTM